MHHQPISFTRKIAPFDEQCPLGSCFGSVRVPVDTIGARKVSLSAHHRAASTCRLIDERERRCAKHTCRFHHAFQVVPNGPSACLVYVCNIEQGIVTATKSGRICGGRRDWRDDATRSPVPPPVPRRDHQLRCLAVPRVQPQPAGR
jgi:hypothetical protein